MFMWSVGPLSKDGLMMLEAMLWGAVAPLL